MPEGKTGFVLLPGRRAIERLPETVAGLHCIIFDVLAVVHAAPIMQSR